MARDLDVPVLALSQLSRDVEKVSVVRVWRIFAIRRDRAGCGCRYVLHDPKSKDSDDSGTGNAGIIELIVEKPAR